MTIDLLKAVRSAELIPAIAYFIVHHTLSLPDEEVTLVLAIIYRIREIDARIALRQPPFEW